MYLFIICIVYSYSYICSTNLITMHLKSSISIFLAICIWFVYEYSDSYFHSCCKKKFRNCVILSLLAIFHMNGQQYKFIYAIDINVGKNFSIPICTWMIIKIKNIKHEKYPITNNYMHLYFYSAYKIYTRRTVQHEFIKEISFFSTSISITLISHYCISLALNSFG